jgi:hypothetical protein
MRSRKPKVDGKTKNDERGKRGTEAGRKPKAEG